MDELRRRCSWLSPVTIEVLFLCVGVTWVLLELEGVDCSMLLFAALVDLCDVFVFSGVFNSFR